jgi:hypothetical protein
MQLWHRRAPQDAQRKLKRRHKRHRAKLDKVAESSTEAADGTDDSAWIEGLSAADEWEVEGAWRPDVALRSFAFLPKRGSSSLCQVAGLLANNSIQVATFMPVRMRLMSWMRY